MKPRTRIWFEDGTYCVVPADEAWEHREDPDYRCEEPVRDDEIEEGEIA